MVLRIKPLDRLGYQIPALFLVENAHLLRLDTLLI